MAASREGILVVAADGRVLQVNPRAQTQLRTTTLEMSGGAIWDCFEASDGVAIAGALEEIAGGRSDSMTLAVRTAAGSAPIQARFLPLLDPAGGITDEVLILLDEGNGLEGD
jgi:PAS domain-containing protein